MKQRDEPGEVLADATRVLMTGEPIVGTLLWAATIPLVFAPLSLRAFTRRG